MSIFSFLFSAFSCSAKGDDYRSVNVVEFEKVISDTTVVRLDVRTAEEFAQGHIAGAINIDVLGADFEQKAAAVLPKDKTIALYCRSGRRSKTAATTLAKENYNVVELSSGYLGWTGSNKPVTTK